MGEQFVFGWMILVVFKWVGKYKDIGFFDMLGEGVWIVVDVQCYYQCYFDVIEVVGVGCGDGLIEKVYGVLVKLLVLNVSYLVIKEECVMDEFYLMVFEQVCVVKVYDIGFCIDVEEFDCLIILLKIFDWLVWDLFLCGWNGLGLVVQVY